MLIDQEKTKRVTEKPQPGACLHCHASIIPAYRAVGLKLGAKPEDAVMKGFEEISAMKYKDAHDMVDANGKKMVEHPVSCVDCHDPQTMALRVSRPGFINGIRAYKASLGVKDYDVNKMATRQEMRSFVCGQCHVEYYFKGDRKTVTYPWANGLKVEEIEKYYDTEKFTDWKHAETGAPVLKAQHPEFEMWSQGIHARSGVTCADCHMPYQREGALKVSDHWVRSPLVNINRACQQCHHYSEDEIKTRVSIIQSRNHDLMQRASKALINYLDVMKTIRAPIDAKTEAEIGAKIKSENPNPDDLKKKMKEARDERWAKVVAADEDLKSAWDLQKKAQWRLDYVAAENSMGFHAPQEAARILAESTDYFRQAEIAARNAAHKAKK
jgi:nitrite reductase (cytochrome c-552)